MNCFRSLYLWVDLQQSTLTSRRRNCCELLSFFVPLGWFTADAFSTDTAASLWIAFVLCTFGLIYSNCSFILDIITVVNCFRSLYLWVDLQRKYIFINTCGSCELLSFFVPLGWFTAWFDFWLRTPSLWIAFVLCTFGLIYSAVPHGPVARIVVNCFRSLYLWVDLQR